MAKQKVALECLSYHATASQDQTVSLVSAPLKSAEDYKLFSFKFVGENVHINYSDIFQGFLGV
jgi:cGMP-specific 3',5'-cyclic phosphodiesterase, invertebrate